MKPFNLQKAKAGKPVCTRDGRSVRILCFDRMSFVQPIVALIKDDEDKVETPMVYRENGCVLDDKESPKDLMMVGEKKCGWINVYVLNKTNGTKCGSIIYPTKEEAIKSIGTAKEHVSTVYIEWEE